MIYWILNVSNTRLPGCSSELVYQTVSALFGVLGLPGWENCPHSEIPDPTLLAFHGTACSRQTFVVSAHETNFTTKPLFPSAHILSTKRISPDLLSRVSDEH